MANATIRKRCAIYTRKSTEEGLDQAFNSLDAQFEACAAYILSQQHEGWTAISDRYDDGGYSGGNIERPGLQQLLADVKAGRIDVVVVYKIDRLTRSLADFAKIVEVFDAANTSFVSVTQAFNTTNSMGRLTLNVLLSFAQFEREVIAERVRDKVAASKAKGIWMGGPVPLGYAVKDRKLIIVPEEAERVRTIMKRYLASSSVRTLLTALERDGIVSKRRIMRDGSVRGGIPFRRGALYALLANRIYLGLTVHKGTAYPGEHEAIVSQELFDAVQAKLAERTNPRSPRQARKIISLLAGMIRDHVGRPMTPTHTQNHGRRYRYYVSHPVMDGEPAALRLPAGELDAAVRNELVDMLTDTGRTRELAKTAGTDTLARFIHYCNELGRTVREVSIAELRILLQSLDLAIIINPAGVTASFSGDALASHGGFTMSDLPRIELAIATHRAAFGHEPRLRLDPPTGVANRTDQRLVEVIARSFAARDQLLAMSDDDVARMPVTRLRHLQRVARLSYLDPAMVRAILAGEHPQQLSARDLWRHSSLPVRWSQQRELVSPAA